jgi:hypothetical protein
MFDEMSHCDLFRESIEIDQSLLFELESYYPDWLLL